MTSFVAIDFETATARRDSACAVGLAAGCGGRVVLARTYLIRPLEAQFTFTGLHGIRWEDVRDAPTFADLWPVLRAWTDAAAFIAAHNAPFDRSVLHACCARYRLRPPRTPFACTVQLARAHWGIYPTKLPDVCRRLRIGLRHHDAGADALACARIVLAAQAEGWRPKRRATRFITASRQWRAAAARRDRGTGLGQRRADRARPPAPRLRPGRRRSTPRAEHDNYRLLEGVAIRSGGIDDNGRRMLDTHAVARSLTDAEFTPAQADAITNAVRQAAEQGDHVTSDQFTAGLAEVRTEIAALDTRLSTQIANLDTRLSTQIAAVRTEVANLETRLIRWMVGTVLATGGLTFAILRFLG